MTVADSKNGHALLTARDEKKVRSLQCASGGAFCGPNRLTHPRSPARRKTGQESGETMSGRAAPVARDPSSRALVNHHAGRYLPGMPSRRLA